MFELKRNTMSKQWIRISSITGRVIYPPHCSLEYYLYFM